MPRPSDLDFRITLDTLLWLHENEQDGYLRDEISHVRHRLHEETDA